MSGAVIGQFGTYILQNNVTIHRNMCPSVPKAVVKKTALQERTKNKERERGIGYPLLYEIAHRVSKSERVRIIEEGSIVDKTKATHMLSRTLWSSRILTYQKTVLTPRPFRPFRYKRGRTRVSFFLFRFFSFFVGGT